MQHLLPQVLPEGALLLCQGAGRGGLGRKVESAQRPLWDALVISGEKSRLQHMATMGIRKRLRLWSSGGG